MNLLVADTDVVSFEIKKDSRAELYRGLLNNHLTSISFMTLAELNVWAIGSGWGAHRMNEFHKSIENYIILDSRHDISRLWAETTISVKKKGKHIACADAWNAAVALYYNLPLVTHNRKDYEAVPKLKLITMNKK